MGKVLFMRKGETHMAPSAGIRLGDIAEGSIVKLNENGSPVEFYVAKHDYESALNGAGRTLLVRKDCYDLRIWGEYGLNKYPTSGIDSWLNNTYAALLDAAVRNAINLTSFYYTVGGSSTTVTTLSRAIFLLSAKELGATSSGVNNEGTELPIANVLKIAYRGGSKVSQWTRSPYAKSITSGTVIYGYTDGSFSGSATNFTYGSRPCFTLPSGALFDEETMLFYGKVVA